MNNTIKDQELVIPAKDEYLGEDGLLCCRRCHTPRQRRMQLFGGEMIIRIRCECQQKEYDLLEEERRQEEHRKKVRRLKAAGLQGSALYDYRFENDNGSNPQMNHAHTYVDHWEDMRKDGTGLLLWGDVGTGKSFFAGCIANALLEKEIPVMMTNFAKILNSLTGMYSEGRNDYIDDLNRYELLIIDDLGIERDTDFANEQIFNVIDSRYLSMKPMIVCTNLTLREMQFPADLAHKRIYDRVLERCVPIKIDGHSFRQTKAQENLKRAKALFVQPSA